MPSLFGFFFLCIGLWKLRLFDAFGWSDLILLIVEYSVDCVDTISRAQYEACSGWRSRCVKPTTKGEVTPAKKYFFVQIWAS